MARRFFKRKASRSRFTRRTRSGRSSSGIKPMDVIIGAAIYSFARPYVVSVIPTQVSSALGGYGDEAALGTLGYFTADGKLGKNKTIRGIGYGALVIETSRVVSGMAGDTSTKSGSTSTYGGWE